MLNSRIIAGILFFLGIIMLCWLLTPFISNDSGALIHTHITFVGKLIVGRFLIYIAILAAVCVGVAKLGTAKNPR